MTMTDQTAFQIADASDFIQMEKIANKDFKMQTDPEEIVNFGLNELFH